MEANLILSLTILLMLLGLAGSILPVMPGAPLILLGACIYAWHTDFAVITWSTLLLFAALALAGQALDYLAGVYGARKMGAGRWGMAGAFAGGTLGLFLGGILGLITGAFLCAFSLELLMGKSVNTSLKIGFGTILGFLGGAIGKLILSAVMIAVFIVKVIS